MWASLSALAALPAATRVYCGHEYTLANLRFAQAVEPRQCRTCAARQAREQATRERGEPTLPSTIGDRARDQSVPARARGPRCARRRSAMRGSRCADDVAAFAALREWKNAF